MPNDTAYPNLTANNLLQNVDNRSMESSVPSYDRNGVDKIGVDYCYRVTGFDVYENEFIYELTLELQTRSLVNALIVY